MKAPLWLSKAAMPRRLAAAAATLALPSAPA